MKKRLAKKKLPQKITLQKSLIDHLFALHAQGKHVECENECLKLLKQYPSLAPILNLLGGSMVGQLRYEEAIGVFDKVIQIDARFFQAHLNRGISCYHLQRYEESILSLDRALAIEPTNMVALYTKGIALNDLMRFKEAAEVLRNVVKVEDDNLEALHALGYALENIGKLEESIKYYNLAIGIKKDYFEAIASLGRVNSILGNKSEAIQLYQKSLDINPNNARAHRAYSRLVTYKEDDPYIPVMENLYRERKLQDKGHVQLCFALAKAYEDIGRYEESFQRLKEANDLHKKTMNYNVLGEIQLIQYIMEVFKKSPLQIYPDEFPNPDISPVFILGMPRSGTSLVEQILSTHTQVHGAGELGIIRELTHELVFSKKQARVFTKEERRIFRDRFLSYLQSLQVPEKIIIDKMPHNFLYIGYIFSAFPNAKIIHLNRDPIAVCWSMYQRFFPAQGLNFCYDLDDLATFQRLHDNLMRFWNDLYPGKIYEIHYEKLTENQEEETRKLLEYCDLPWQDDCLNFHKTKREVKTASLGQVRNKMYTGSSEAWRKFETQLQPLIKSLNYKV